MTLDEMWPQDQGWMQQAVCAGTDPVMWFPDKGGSNARALEICRSCPVQVECLDFAMETGDQHGIYGGTSPRDRVKLRQRARTA